MPESKEKNKGGHPPHEPSAKDRKMVEVLCGYGVPYNKIIAVIGITKPTLIKHYRAELDRGAATVEAQLIGNLLRLAGGADGTALKAIMFSLQCRFGWSQYAPEIARDVPLGKKEAADIEATTAHEGNPWGNLVH